MADKRTKISEFFIQSPLLVPVTDDAILVGTQDGTTHGIKVLQLKEFITTSFVIIPVNTATYFADISGSLFHVAYTVTGSVTITISSARIAAGESIIITDGGLNAGTNNILIQTEGTEKISGEDTFVLENDGEAISAYSYNGNMFVF